MAGVRTSDFDFDLPRELIAQHPCAVRDRSRLLVLKRSNGTIEHRRFYELPEILSPQDLLVLNDTRVFPARLLGLRCPDGGRVEVFLIRALEEPIWECLVRPGRRVRPGSRLSFGAGELRAEVIDRGPGGKRIVRFENSGDFWERIEKVGQSPLPPYIKREKELPEDRERYQTVFARRRGSIAAPTAGLHFSKEMLGRLRVCRLTLHVGYGTFKPMRVERVEDHVMDAEYYDVPEASAEQISRQVDSVGSVIAVGTTSTRTLEHVVRQRGLICADSGWTSLFIFPGFPFRVVNGLITNFHLPRSSLYVLVCAFAGKELIEAAYREAIERRYRFYSYGDAMLIL